MSVDRTALLRELEAIAPRQFREHATIYRPLLDAVLAEVDANGRLTAKGLARVERGTFEAKRASRRTHRSQLTRALQAMNETGRIDAVLPVTKTLAPRPALLAVSPEQARSQITARAMDAYLDTWWAERREADAQLLAFAMRLVTRAGLGERVVAGVLARLRPVDVGADGTLALPIALTDFTASRYTLRPPKACRSLLPGRKARRQSGGAQALLFSATLGNAPQSQEEARAQLDHVRETLQALFARFAADFRKHNTTPGATITSWRRFASAARLLPLGRGVPPVFVDLVESFPLPASATLGDDQPMALLRAEATVSANARILRPVGSSGRGSGARGTLDRRTPGPVVITSAALPDDWSRRVRNLLTAFVYTAQSLATKSGTLGRSKNKRNALLGARDRFLRQADGIMPTPSVLHLALAWGTRKLISDGIKVSTLKTYFSRLFSLALLTEEETADMQHWDDDTIQEITAHVLANRRWDARTVGHFLGTWAEFLGYAQSVGMLGEAEIAIERGENVHRASRTAIVTPGEFDYVWRVLQAGERDREAMQWGVALTLGYYGGLRASEVVGLTLRDIYIACGEVWVMIRAGKTPAARRSIPLHAVAPPDTLAQFERWVARRREEVGPGDLQTIGVFGPQGEAAAYNREGLITPLLEWLRPILGPGVDFHLLRHSTASWLLLRLHAARSPGFRDSLHHGRSWMFSAEALASVRALFAGPGAGAHDAPCHDWLYVAKFMGHRDLGTLLLHYSHTLGPIHSDVLEQAWAGRPRQ